LDGQQQHALKPLQPNFGEGLYIAYVRAGTGKLNRDEGNHISREDFANGYALYAFDLTADIAEDDHFNLVKNESVRLALKFSQATLMKSRAYHVGGNGSKLLPLGPGGGNFPFNGGNY